MGRPQLWPDSLAIMVGKKKSESFFRLKVVAAVSLIVDQDRSVDPIIATT